MSGRPEPGEARCTGIAKRTGQQCNRRPIAGGTVCRVHGGAAPQVKAAAKRRLEIAAAARELAALGEPIAADPAQALLDLVHHKAGEVVWLRAMVQSLESDDLVWGMASQVDKDSGEFPGTDTTREAKPSVWWAMLRTAEDQLASFAAAALKAGVAERQIQLAEREGALVAGVIQRILDRLVLSPEQLVLVPTVVPQELRALTVGGAT